MFSNAWRLVSFRFSYGTRQCRRKPFFRGLTLLSPLHPWYTSLIWMQSAICAWYRRFFWIVRPVGCVCSCLNPPSQITAIASERKWTAYPPKQTEASNLGITRYLNLKKILFDRQPRYSTKRTIRLGRVVLAHQSIASETHKCQIYSRALAKKLRFIEVSTKSAVASRQQAATGHP